MEQHGKNLAAAHRLTSRRGADQLLPRLAANEAVLVDACNLLTAAVRANRRVTPAGEWLLDNFYLIEEHVRTAKRHLPKGYSRELPRLAGGPSAGLPRAYDIALETIAHGDGRVSAESLARFVAAYQTVTPVTLGELWAIPIMLRLALIENLRRVATEIAASTVDRTLAEGWADQMNAVLRSDAKSLILVTADMARSDPPMTTAFVSELSRRLQGHGPALALPLTWIDQRLSESHLSIEQLVQAGSRQQAASQVSISNSIGSLRLLGATDWRKFVETLSAVEAVLLQDPAGCYGRMDFVTRDRYRHAVERLAKLSSSSEVQVADEAIALARAGAARSTANDRETHVGFYLIGAGAAALEQAVKTPVAASAALLRPASRVAAYLALILGLTVVFTAGLASIAGVGEPRGVTLAVLAVLSLLATSQLAVALVNWLLTSLVTPRLLPRMDFSRGLPPEERTLVVVPALLTSAAAIEHLFEALEVRFLANRDSNLHFALLTDFVDAGDASMPEDAGLLQVAQRCVRELNGRYPQEAGDAGGAGAGDRFYLLHRPRVWNPNEGVWMGYERKRGKLADLNALLRDDDATSRFMAIVGETKALRPVKYVITLDADTQLPRGAARQLVAAMAHPLNRPEFDETRKRVTGGYGILQPRVVASLPGANRSHYARLFGGDPGIDPYTRAVSDVYQDGFGEGSFIGKGIYDVDAFERALTGRFPENRILSHDLLEGSYVRAGLITDVQLYEDHPSRYSEDVRRRLRWIRGDWQIASWILPRVPGGRSCAAGNPPSLLSRWKLFDNLRRSLFPVALLLLLLLGWSVLPPAWAWSVAAVAIVYVPSLIASLLETLRWPAGAPLAHHLRSSARGLARRTAQIVYSLACLPYEAYVSAGAILRTHWRTLVTHRRLLEWTQSSHPVHDAQTTLRAALRSMWVGPATAVTAAGYLAAMNPAAIAAAIPFLLLWMGSPILAWWLSRPLTPRVTRFSSEQTLFLHRLARRTWGYFETFVGPEDNWLPPDNYQQAPVDTIAHRTSPTNIGMALLAELAAHDFGYQSTGPLVERLSNTLDTMDRLDRYHGHFYNWYDTISLQPLAPRYVSSVDSGNLTAHLLTLRAGLAALPADRILEPRHFGGLLDTGRVLAETTSSEASAAIVDLLRVLEEAQAARPDTTVSAKDHLARIALALSGTDSWLSDGSGSEPDRATSEAGAWLRALATQRQNAADELRLFTPWWHCAGLDDALRELPVLAVVPTLHELARLTVTLGPQLDRLRIAATPAMRGQLDEISRLAHESSARAQQRIQALADLASRCEGFAQMDFGFLYDETRHLFTIGFNVDERQRDSSHYDLLASEARLSNFVAIAQGQVPQDSWFALGRLLTSAGDRPLLLSWSGSMFEYLMPLLVMPTYERTLLDETCRAAVDRHVAYGKQLGVPWGISESGYNHFDASLNYQYRAFGVPDLGMKRGLAEDIVVAPYASALALMIAPKAACANLQRLASEGLAGPFGLFEAVDYTRTRLPPGLTSVVVRSFMAHHQGMSLLALAQVLLDRPMQRRFESDPLFQATLLLLQERIPREVALLPQATQVTGLGPIVWEAEAPVRVISDPFTAIPQVQLLSNGRYHVMVTGAGGGSSRWRDVAVTRWREDATCDDWGTFCYLRDVDSGEFWSTAHQPSQQRADHYEAIFSEGRAEFRRRDQGLEVHTEIAVSPEDDVELRRTRIVNCAGQRRTIEVTSYTEVVLASQASDAIHPAFSNLFVQTEIVPDQQAILCTRRPRSPDERTPWMFHQVAVHGTPSTDVSYETDRMRFVGRGNTRAAPQALQEPGLLSGTEGSVLDPIAAIRVRLTLEPDESATVDLVYGVAESRDVAIALVERYQDSRLADRVGELAWTHAQVVLRQINATESDARLYASLANSILFANPSLRAEPAVIARNRRGQSGLWGYAISGDLPIVLLRIEDSGNIDLVRQMVQAHAYWRLKGLAVDLVIWNEDRAGYRQLLQDQIMSLIAARVEAQMMDRPGGIFVRRGDQMSDEDRGLLESVARVIVSDGKGTLAEQISGRAVPEVNVARLAGRKPRAADVAASVPAAPVLILENGLGGFTTDGTEYRIVTDRGHLTPAPWVNVLANPGFGAVVSESGGTYTWGENAHEYRLTPWHNDPVSDASGEAIYVRDDDSGHFWSPTPLPARGRSPYVTRHGFGYTVFEHEEDGIRTELWVYVDCNAAVKFSALRIHNASRRKRSISSTGYVEWVLGDLRPKSVMHVVTETDGPAGALYARNAYSAEFGERVAFFDVDGSARTWTCDRTEFIGRNGTLAEPAAMKRAGLSGRTGPALDPCAALQVTLELEPGGDREIVFRLGVGRDVEDARSLVQRFRGPTAARTALDAVRRQWRQILGAIQVKTPAPALDVLCNGWLVYQTLACRLWARSGFYQSGGAFGFRDQLQDVLALVHADAGLTREQLLLCASRQFVEGDVQHWWHPPSGRGVRTQCSDDYLWLPLAIARYVVATGDAPVLDQQLPFLEGRPIKAGEDSYYDLPGRAAEVADLYEHGVRAIEHGLRFGPHGLPLIGSGDWNDGMNLVGIEGRGESVWLGFFLCSVLIEFAEVARMRGDLSFARRCADQTAVLRRNLEEHAWDGAWYRRAYFDDGTPVGSAANSECRIDSISQSWSVLSGIGSQERAREAMAAVREHLVRKDDGLIQLLAPPFDQSEQYPGYIRGYVPGVRENGGQYTHAAIWSAMAFAALGDSHSAWELTDLINPVNHGRSPAGVAKYRVEPYVIAADVYAMPPHTGRGGWSWYTGSAGWMYRLIVESLLGVTRAGDTLRFRPCLPSHWDQFELRYRYRDTLYRITVSQARTGERPLSVWLDGDRQSDASIPLVNDLVEHAVHVIACADSSA